MQKDISVGLDLLMNPKKRSVAGSDDVSVISSVSGGGGGGGGSGGGWQGSSGFAGAGPSTARPPYQAAPPTLHFRESDAASSSSSDSDSDSSSEDGGGPRASSSESSSSSSSSSEPPPTYRYRGDFRDAPPPRQQQSDEELLNMKREILYQFDRLEKKGVRLPRKFTLASSYDEMKHEYDRLIRDRETDNSVNFQRKMLLACVNGIEFLNTRFDPFSVQLEGWSDSVHENLNDYDDVFEELHSKYRGSAKMAPELRLLFMLGGSAMMYHITHSMLKSFPMPGMDQVLRQNPQLAKDFARATADTMSQQQQQQSGGGGGGMSGLFSMFFGGGGGSGSASGSAYVPPPPQQQQTTMRGPTNVDDILSEIQKSAFVEQEIDVVSNDSMSELSLPEEASPLRGDGGAGPPSVAARGAPPPGKGAAGRGRRRTLNV